MTTKRTCEYHDVNEWDRPCGNRASFNVSRGRKFDAQDSCKRHLAATVVALMQQEDKPVTVTRIDTGA
jgi:hypothetical protein